MAARVGVADLRRELEVVAYDDVGHAHKEQYEDEIQHDHHSLSTNQASTQITQIKRKSIMVAG